MDDVQNTIATEAISPVRSSPARVRRCTRRRKKVLSSQENEQPDCTIKENTIPAEVSQANVVASVATDSDVLNEDELP